MTLPRGTPVLNPTKTQLWEWAGRNAEFSAKLLTLPEDRREEALNIIYQASLRSWFDKVWDAELQRLDEAVAQAAIVPQRRGSHSSEETRSRSRSPVRRSARLAAKRNK